MVETDKVDGSKAGEDAEEIDCLRTDLNARDAAAAMTGGLRASRATLRDGWCSVLDPNEDQSRISFSLRMRWKRDGGPDATT